MISRNGLLDSLGASQDRFPSATPAIRHLEAHSFTEHVRPAHTATHELLRIYRRRLRRIPKGVVGIEGLVDSLESTESEAVDLYHFASAGTMTYVFLSPAGDIIGCVVGPDRRFKTPRGPMKADELRHRLDQLKVPERSFSLGADRDESYCLILENGLWRVFYSERGNRVHERAFVNDREAEEDLLHRLLRDETVRRSIAESTS